MANDIRRLNIISFCIAIHLLLHFNFFFLLLLLLFKNFLLFFQFSMRKMNCTAWAYSCVAVVRHHFLFSIFSFLSFRSLKANVWNDFSQCHSASHSYYLMKTDLGGYLFLFLSTRCAHWPRHIEVHFFLSCIFFPFSVNATIYLFIRLRTCLYHTQNEPISNWIPKRRCISSERIFLFNNFRSDASLLRRRFTPCVIHSTQFWIDNCSLASATTSKENWKRQNGNEMMLKMLKKHHRCRYVANSTSRIENEKKKKWKRRMQNKRRKRDETRMCTRKTLYSQVFNVRTRRDVVCQTNCHFPFVRVHIDRCHCSLFLSVCTRLNETKHRILKCVRVLINITSE